jgi:hypothetical protein
MAGAAADVPFVSVVDFPEGGAAVFVQQSFGGYDETGRTEAALRRALVNVGLLDGVELAIRAGQALNGSDAGSTHPLHRNETGAHGLTVLDDHAAAAVAGRAAVFDAGQAEIITKHIHQESLRHSPQVMLMTIDDECIGLFF